MNIDDLTLGQVKEITRRFRIDEKPSDDTIPRYFDNPVVAQFIGRFVFVCDLKIEGGFCFLTNVRNVRFWESRTDGLGGLAKFGPKAGDIIDKWPDQIIPLDKLGPVMMADKEFWS